MTAWRGRVTSGPPPPFLCAMPNVPNGPSFFPGPLPATDVPRAGIAGAVRTCEHRMAALSGTFFWAEVQCVMAKQNR